MGITLGGGIAMIHMGNDGKKWPETFDAAAWADAWLLTLKEHPGIADDRQTMIGWFANAIMRGYDQKANEVREQTRLDQV